MKRTSFLLLAILLVLSACAPAAPATPVVVTQIVFQEVTSTPVPTATSAPTTEPTLVPQISPTPADACFESLAVEQARIQAKITEYRDAGKSPNWEPNIQLTKLETKGEQFDCLFSVTFRTKVSKYDGKNIETYKAEDLISFLSIVKDIYGAKEAYISLYIVNDDKSLREITVENYKGENVAGIMLYVNLIPRHQ
jgi:hypothetical protein